MARQLLSAEQRVVYEVIEQRRGRMPAPYWVLLASPEITEIFDRLSIALQSGVLPPAVLEAVFLMTARQRCCRYLWVNHHGRALQAGVTETEAQAFAEERVPSESTVITVAARFHAALTLGHQIPQDLCDEVGSQLGPRALGELVAFCGFAVTIAMLLNVRQPTLPITSKQAPF